MKIFESPYFLCMIAAVFVASSQVSWGQTEIEIVSPPGYEDSNAPRSFIPNANDWPYPTHPDPPGAFFGRFQELHSASTFLEYGSGPFEIASLAWRPHRSVNEPFSVDWPISMRLSTTSVGDLHLTFADNGGPDGLVEVYSGVVELATDGVPRSDSLPHDFDYMFEFDTPFRYDPQSGDLLVDVVWNEPDVDPWVWAEADGSVGQYVEAFQPGTVAANKDSGLFVTQFTTIPEPSGFFPAVTSVFALLAAIRRRRM